MEQKQVYPYPTEKIDLPSRGIIYPEGSPLKQGYVDIKYMTAKEEDILTNTRLLEEGTALNELLKSVVVTPGVNVDDMIAGDRNKVMLAARILGYGKDYTFKLARVDEAIKLDLTTIEDKKIDESNFKAGVNEFQYEIPETKTILKFKLLTGHDEKKIQQYIKGMKRINSKFIGDISVTLKHSIISVNGHADPKSINDFVDNRFIAKHRKEFSAYVASISPDINIQFDYTLQSGEVLEGLRMPITVDFFWPDFTGQD